MSAAVWAGATPGSRWWPFWALVATARCPADLPSRSEWCWRPRGRPRDRRQRNYLIHGLIDPHVHWGLSRYEFDYHDGLVRDFETETRGAVHGGVTTGVNFLLQPEVYLPDVGLSSAPARRASYVDFAYHAIVHQAHHVDGFEGLAAERVRSFKFFLN